MSPQSNSIGFLYLDQNGLLMFTSTMPAVLQFAFPPDVVRDLEVINKQLLQNELQNLIKANNIQPSRFVIALSENVLFEKPFHDSKSPDTQKEIQEFLDNMPFEHTATIIFENAESKLIATNRDLYQTLSHLFEQEGSVVDYIFPSYVLGVDVNQALAMTKDRLSEIYRRAPSIRQYSFLTDTTQQPQGHAEQKADSPQAKKEDGKGEKTSNTRTFVLVGVFVLLLVVLAVAAFLSFRK
ncbi:MAG: hypothetical protein Q8Q49_01770 [bacterium]|nr:hypothetical protein [bacterium]